MVPAGSRQLKGGGKKDFSLQLFAALRFTGVPRHDSPALHCLVLHCPPAAALNLLPCDSLFLPGKSETSDEKKSESGIGGNLHLFFTGQILDFWPTNLTIHELTGPKKKMWCVKKILGSGSHCLRVLQVETAVTVVVAAEQKE